MEFKSNTYGDIYGPAMELTTKEEADDWWESAVENMVSRCDKSREEAEDMVGQNLGYWTGYYDTATAQRVFELFAHRNVSHPIFGKRADVTPEEAFNAGFELARRAPRDGERETCN